MIIKKFTQNTTAPKSKRKRSRRLILVSILVLFVFFFITLPIIRIKSASKRLTKSGSQLKAAFKKNDMDLVQKELKAFDADYTKFEKASSGVYWAAFIPYVADYKNAVNAGHYMLKAGEDAVVAIAPHADLIGFKKGSDSFSNKTAEERLQTAVLTLDTVVNRIDPISQNIEKAEEYAAKINPNRYPKKLGKTFVRGQVSTFKDSILGASTLFVDAKPLLKKLPDILGKDKKKTYLILFQNEKERRATGGFLTSYAVFTVEKGKIKKESSDDVYQLDNSIGSHPTAPDKILKYHKNVSQFYIRDSNLSPDFVESLKLFNSLYKKSSRKVDYDGVITIDSKVLVDLLRIFGDTKAGGITFSAENDKRCDCPQVIYTLFDVVDRPVNYVKEDRKGILGLLMQELLYKILGFSPSRYWGPFIQNSFANMDEKHILLNFKDADIQNSIERLNYGGRIRNFDGDYLHINNVNFAGAKSNLFVSEKITSETTFSGSSVDRKVSIVFSNPFPHSDCGLESGGLCLNAILRNWIRVYVPQGSQLKEFKGSTTRVLTYDELDKTVFEGFMTVSPGGGRAQVDVTYTLPTTITPKNYKIMIQKQPGIGDVAGQKLGSTRPQQELTVNVGNKVLFDNPFVKDLVLGAK